MWGRAVGLNEANAETGNIHKSAHRWASLMWVMDQERRGELSFERMLQGVQVRGCWNVISSFLIGCFFSINFLLQALFDGRETLYQFWFSSASQGAAELSRASAGVLCGDRLRHRLKVRVTI